MKKILITFLMITLVASLLLTGCSGSGATKSSTEDTKPSQSDTSLEDIKKAGKFVVGLDDSFPPMGFRNEKDEIVGFDVDMAKEAAKRMGVEIELKPIDWDSKVLELNGKKIDVIWNGLTITEERKKEIAFTKPYLENRQIIVVAAGSDIKTKADLAGKKVGVQSGSSSMDALEKDEKTLKSLEEVVEFGNNTEALMDLKIGRIDAVVVDEVVGRYYISKKPGEYTVLEDHFGSEEYGVGLRLGDQAFLSELQKVLDEMKKDGTSAKISKKWFGEDIVK